MPLARPFSRIVWLVLDSVGIGALPDANQHGDAGRNTLGHVARSLPLAIQPRSARAREYRAAAAPIGA